jgi:hypothetical protein
MRRWLVWPLSILLAVATGAALSDTVAVVQAPLPAVVQTQTTAAAVRAFYEAANAVLRTGDASALGAGVPADFVDHADLPGVAPDRAGLGRYLASLHDAAPGARLTVADLTAVGDWAMARVVVVGAEAGTFLGVPLAGSVPVWGRVDAFRVGGGRVRERWGEGEGLLCLAAMGRLPLGARLPPLAGVLLERVTLGPGDRVAGPPLESRLIAVEAGTLTVALDPASAGQALAAAGGAAGGPPRVVAPGTTVDLSGGDLLALAAPIRYILRNDDAEPATALVAAVFAPNDPRRAGSNPPSTSAYPGTPWPPGVSAEAKAGGVVTEVPGGAVVAGIGRATLAPGTRLGAFAAPGPVLLAVEGGTLDFVATEGAVWVSRGADGSNDAARTGALAVGDGALLSSDDAVTLRNLGADPAVVLVLTIAPAG